MKNSCSGKSIVTFVMFALLFATVFFVSGRSVLGQATTGVLRGVVADANGGAVAGATMTAKNDATSAVVTTTTGGEGNYEHGRNFAERPVADLNND